MRTKRIARGRFHRSSLRPDLATTARPLPPPFTDNISNVTDRSADSVELHSSTENVDNVSHARVISGDEDMDDFVENTCLECDKGGEGLLICCGIDCPVALHEGCFSIEPKYDDGKFYCPYCMYKLQIDRTRELRKKAMLARKNFDSFLKLNPEMAYLDKEKQNNEREKGKDMNVGESNRCGHVNSMNVDDEVHKGAREVCEDHQRDSNEKFPCSDQSGEVDECIKISAAHAHEIQAKEKAMEVEQGKNDRLDDANVDEECAESLDVQCVAEETVFDDAFQGSPGTESGTSNASERDQVSMEKEEETEATRKPVEEFEHVDTLSAQCVAGKTLVDGALQGSSGTKSGTSNASEQDQVSMEKEEETEATRKTVEEVERVDAFKAQCVAGKTLVDGALQGSSGTKSGTSNTSEQDRVSMEKKEQMNKGAPTANVPCISVDGALNEPEVPDSEKATSKPIEELAYSEKPKQTEIPAKKRKKLPFAHEKRRRIIWKLEEENALREGVHKYSTEINKNVPWRKILELGGHIFDPSRTPTDLKDKWKNMSKHSY